MSAHDAEARTWVPVYGACPFCGNDDAEDWEIEPVGAEQFMRVVCRCGAAGPIVAADEGGAVNAVFAWNGRAPNKCTECADLALQLKRCTERNNDIDLILRNLSMGVRMMFAYPKTAEKRLHLLMAWMRGIGLNGDPLRDEESQ